MGELCEEERLFLPLFDVFVAGVRIGSVHCDRCRLAIRMEKDIKDRNNNFS